MSTCDGSAEQQWTLQGDGTIRNQGHCLAVQHAGTTSMTPVWLYTCDGGPAQLWRTGSNHAVVNPNSGLCLADSHSATADGNPIWVYTCDGGPPSGGACRAWPPIRPVRRCRWGTSPDGRRSSRTTSPRTCRWAASRRRSPANGPPTPTGGPDTSGNGTYEPSKVVSIGHGVMDLYLHTENGVHMVSAPEPVIPGAPGGEGGLLYGRYAMRFRADQVPGYKTAWLLWPDSENWADGEIDFPKAT